MRNKKNTHRVFKSAGLALATAGLMLLGARAAAAQKAQDGKNTASVAPLTSAFKSHKEELSYAIGANLGNGLREESVEVDPNLLLQGLKEGLAGKPTLLSPHEVNIVVNAMQEELRAKKIKEAAQRLAAAEELAAKNQKAGEAFLAENKTKDGVVALKNGLQYKILKAGEGKKPAANDTVICNYRGTFIDGTEFDSSYKRNKPATIPLHGGIIKGWSQALQLMPVGSKWQIFVPADLAYGPRGLPPKIGPNAALVFEVELLAIQDQAANGPRAAGAQTSKVEAVGTGK